VARSHLVALIGAWLLGTSAAAQAQVTAPSSSPPGGAQPPGPTTSLGSPLATTLLPRSNPPWLGLLRPRQGVFGVQVVEVYEDAGAAAAGIVPGDEILFIERSPVTSVNELVNEVARYRVGDTIEVRLARGGIELALQVQLGARVDDREMLHRRLVGKPAPSASLRRLDDDRRIDPSALRGKVVVLAWFSTRCDACGELISELSELYAGRRDVEVAAVTAAEPALLATYLTRAVIGVPVAVTDDDDFTKYSLLGGASDQAVAFVVIDRHGMVRVAAAIDAREAGGEITATVEDVIAGARQLLRAPRR
jgi:peroxiredoxin